MFEQAFALLQAGNVTEAQELQESARAKRLDASSLMSEAVRLERDSIATNRQ